MQSHAFEPTQHVYTPVCTLNISKTAIMCLWNRWKISLASIVFLQLGFWSRRVLAPVWPSGHCSQGFAMTDSLTIKDPGWLLHWTNVTKQGNRNPPDQAFLSRKCLCLYKPGYTFIVNKFLKCLWFSCFCVEFWIRVSSSVHIKKNCYMISYFQLPWYCIELHIWKDNPPLQDLWWSIYTSICLS